MSSRQSTLNFAQIKPKGKGSTAHKDGKAPARVADVQEPLKAQAPVEVQQQTKRQGRSTRKEGIFSDSVQQEQQQQRPGTRSAAQVASNKTSQPLQPTSSIQTSLRASHRIADKATAQAAQSKAHATPDARREALHAVGNHVKASKRASATSSKQAEAVQYFDRYSVNDDEYKVGDVVYVICTDDQTQWPDDDADDVCVVCNKGHKSHTILECDRCLGGFHMGCLKPPLKKIPEGVWVCEACERGDNPGSGRKLRTTYEKFLFAPSDNEVLALGLIRGFVKNRGGSEDIEFKCQYFCRPQDTHCGRQAHNGSREVMLTTLEHFEPVDSIWGPATVCCKKDFDAQEGTDVFYCEYSYDPADKHFRRSAFNRRKVQKLSDDAQGKPTRSSKARADSAYEVVSEEEEEEEESEEEYSEGDDSDDESYDGRRERLYSDDEECIRQRNHKPIYAFWAERGLIPAHSRYGRGRGGTGAATRRTGGALNKKHAGGVLTAQVGDDDEEGGMVLELTGGGGVSSLPAPAVTSALVVARKALATAAAPDTLPCRDKEKASLRTFMTAAIHEEGGCGPGVLYVCGVPGTGKTACINEVLNGVRSQARQKGTQLVFLNALSLPSPIHVYSKLWEKLTGQHLGPARALAALEATFSAGTQPITALPGAPKPKQPLTSRPCMTLLVVDEIDVLITKNQAVLYNLFEWPTKPGARLAVIGISNTHDLDERVLPRISSRLSSSKLAFNPYTAAQLQEIAEQRLQSSQCKHLINKDAVVMASRKVAGSSGDVRRVLELLRRALEVAEAERRQKNQPLVRPGDLTVGPCVLMPHVLTALKEMYTSPHMQFLRACSRLEKLVLVALLMEMRATSKADTSVAALHDRLLNHVALLVPGARCEVVAVSQAVHTLAAKRLLVTSPAWQALRTRVALNVHKDDVCAAVKDDAALQAVHGQLA